jgi:ubiquinone/menaquinone biosynthesis C-methylase UbiE
MAEAMPFSIILPYSICYPLTRLIRRIRPPHIAKEFDQSAYFEWQYIDTKRRCTDHMAGLDLSGKTVLDVGSGLGGRALEWLELGASQVIDINRQELEAGRAILDERYANWNDQVHF